MDNIVELKPKREFYRAKDIQVMFGIDRSTVDSWARQGILTKIKIGGGVFYNRAEVMALVGV